MPSIQTLLALAAAVAPAYGFWRMECRGVTGYYRMDPIVSPGEPSSHLHSILGSNGFSESSGYSDLLAGDCTSCLATEDKSAYWHPALYFQDEDGSYELVGQVGGTLAYYLLYTGNGNTNITAFPANFRMIAGDQSRRSYTAGNVEMVDPPKSEWASLNQTSQDILAQRALGFNCLDYSGTTEASLYRHFFPNKEYLDANCPDGIRFELMFPSCWNGVDLDSSNHRDHMAYPDLVMSGDCPEGFTTRVPSLFYETIWNTAAFASRSGQFVVSNGDIEGFAYHGDFMSGWEVDVLQEAIETCTNESGELSDCPVFTLQSEAEAEQCLLETPANLASENATGPGLVSLPGDVAVFGSALTATMIATYDAALATIVLAAEATVDAAIVAAATATSVEAIASTSAAAGGNFGIAALAEGASSFFASVADSTTSSVVSVASVTPIATTFSSLVIPSSSTSSSPIPTTPTTTTTVAVETNTAPVMSTQYVTNGGVVTEILWYQDIVYVTEDSTTTVVTSTVTADANVQARHAHNHMRRHGNWAHNHGHM